jgi:hypothetical protein
LLQQATSAGTKVEQVMALIQGGSNVARWRRGAPALGAGHGGKLGLFEIDGGGGL